MSIKVFETLAGVQPINQGLAFEGYFKNENVYMKIYASSIVFVDLENALKTGKTCKRYSIYNNNTNNIALDFYNTYMSDPDGIKDLLEVYTMLKENDFSIVALETYDFKLSIEELKGINVYSPFAEIKPIKKPTKWSLSHIYKAILSGQIYKGEVVGQYTDDYYTDAQDKFNKGKQIDLQDMARDLIRDSHGWRVTVDKEENGIIKLSVDCHSFDYNTLYFDINRRKETLKPDNVNELETTNIINNVVSVDFKNKKRISA